MATDSFGIINAYKSASSRLIKKEYPQIRENSGKKLSGVRVSVCSAQEARRLKQYGLILKVRVRSVNKVIKFRIYPNKEQEEQLARTFGCCRFLYNIMLEDKMREYEKNKKMLKNTPARYKKEYPWLKEVDSLALANVQLHLEKAYQNFFRNPKSGFPKFKSKHRSRRSYTTNVVMKKLSKKWQNYKKICGFRRNSCRNVLSVENL